MPLLPQGSEIGVFVNVGAVYPGAIASEEQMRAALHGMSRDEALLNCARLNALISGFGPQLDPVMRQQRALFWLCTPQERAAINAFAMSYGGASQIAIFLRGQILELARWIAVCCVNQPDDGQSFERPAVRSAFFSCSADRQRLWAQKIFSNRLSDQGDGAHQLRCALGAFRKNLEEAIQAPHAGMVLGRGAILFSKYVREQLCDFDRLFLQATGMSLEEFNVCAAALLLYTFAEPPVSNVFRTDFVAADTAFAAPFAAFMRLQSQTPQDLAQALRDRPADGAFRALRDRPILNLAHGLSVILDPTYFGDNLTIAPLFHVLGRATRQRANEIFGAFGSAFEAYACDLLRGMYPGGSNILFRRLVCGAHGKTESGDVFEVDALLNDVDAAIVFEMKAAWIREDQILTEDHEDFLAQLRAKYGRGGGERDKGVAQLAKSVGALARHEWLGENRALREVRVIYPVLTVHDERMAASGLGNFLDGEFRDLLGAVPKGTVVHPLIVLTVADLENLTSSVENFSLREFLAAYSSGCPERMRSVHNFMATSVFTAKIIPSKALMAASDRLHAVVKATLFPAESGAPVALERSRT